LFLPGSSFSQKLLWSANASAICAKPGQSADLTEQIGDASAADEEPDRGRRLNE